MFAPDPNARSDLKAGTLYAIWGIGNWIHYGQVAADKSVGFSARRDRDIAFAPDVLSSPIMSRVMVAFPSIGRALRAGAWKKLGKYPLHRELGGDRPVVQWPVGTLEVTVWTGRAQSLITRVEDPSIQDLEVIAAWDAIAHIPDRLLMDHAPNEASSTVKNAWSIGGPVWRQRRVKEELARRFPDNPTHRLPADWVPVRRMV